MGDTISTDKALAIDILDMTTDPEEAMAEAAMAAGMVVAVTVVAVTVVAVTVVAVTVEAAMAEAESTISRGNSRAWFAAPVTQRRLFHTG